MDIETDSWEVVHNKHILKDLNKLKKQNKILHYRLKKTNKLLEQVLGNLTESTEFSKNAHIETQVHNKNIRDMLEMFSDFPNDECENGQPDPFTVSRMHNRMWRHSIKNRKDIADIQDNHLMGIYKNFNSK